MLACDLRDRDALPAAIERCRPRELYNLAAATFVPGSWDDPVATVEINATAVDGDARGDPRRSSRHARLPGVLVRGLRGARRGAAERGDAAAPRQPLRHRQAPRPADGGRLPRAPRAARVRRHRLQPRIAAPAARLRDAEGDARCRCDPARARARAGARRPRRPPRLGPRRGLRRGHVAHAPAGRRRRLRAGHGSQPPRARRWSTLRSRASGSTRPSTSASIRTWSAPRSGPSAVATPAAPATGSAGSHRSPSRR